MFTNYLPVGHFVRIAFRNLAKNKTISLINLFGLSLGLAVFILIIKWVQYEHSYNNFHIDGDRIASIQTNRSLGNEITTFPAVPAALADALMKEIPEVELATTTTWGDQRQFTVNDKEFVEYGLYVSPEFLKIFTFPLLNGDKEPVLKEPNTILITEKLAQKYFPNESINEIIGKNIQIEKNHLYKVVGILKNVPNNATLSFNYLMPIDDYFRDYNWNKNAWGNNNVRAYLKWKADINKRELETKLKTFLHTKAVDHAKDDLILWDLKDWYLRLDFKNGKYAGGGRIVYVQLFMIIAFFILILACINFMNLSTAKATQRAKEVGVRKVAGASQNSLIFQFLAEALVMSFISGLVALTIIKFSLPSINVFLRRNISLDYTNPLEIFSYVGILLVTGILAGSYPAFVLSTFKPITVFKSNISEKFGNSIFIRKILVVTQFAVAILLIIGTLLITEQIHFMQNKNLGFDKEKLIWFPNNIQADKTELAMEEIKKIKGVAQIAQASMTFTGANSRTSDVKWQGKQEGNDVFFNFVTTSHEIIETIGLDIIDGRSFSKLNLQDTGTIILNEEAVKRMGIKNPIGQTLETNAGNGKIIGIVKDFHFESFHNPITPMIITCRPDWTWTMYVRLDGHDITQTIKSIESVCQSMAPGFVFDYNFQDQEYDKLYRSEMQVATLVKWFAGFAIFISCLGLFGLTLFTVERKAKEIGIRKVLGAHISHIVYILSKEFIGMVLIAFLIASPIAVYFMNNWLTNFAYKIEIEWWVFAVAGVIAIGIALFTISFQSIKAAVANPIKSLRTD